MMTSLIDDNPTISASSTVDVPFHPARIPAPTQPPPSPHPSTHHFRKQLRSVHNQRLEPAQQHHAGSGLRGAVEVQQQQLAQLQALPLRVLPAAGRRCRAVAGAPSSASPRSAGRRSAARQAAGQQQAQGWVAPLAAPADMVCLVYGQGGLAVLVQAVRRPLAAAAAAGGTCLALALAAAAAALLFSSVCSSSRLGCALRFPLLPNVARLGHNLRSQGGVAAEGER